MYTGGGGQTISNIFCFHFKSKKNIATKVEFLFLLKERMFLIEICRRDYIKNIYVKIIGLLYKTIQYKIENQLTFNVFILINNRF